MKIGGNVDLGQVDSIRPDYITYSSSAQVPRKPTRAELLLEHDRCIFHGIHRVLCASQVSLITKLHMMLYWLPFRKSVSKGHEDRYKWYCSNAWLTRCSETMGFTMQRRSKKRISQTQHLGLSLLFPFCFVYTSPGLQEGIRTHQPWAGHLLMQCQCPENRHQSWTSVTVNAQHFSALFVAFRALLQRNRQHDHQPFSNQTVLSFAMPSCNNMLSLILSIHTFLGWPKERTQNGDEQHPSGTRASSENHWVHERHGSEDHRA